MLALTKTSSLASRAASRIQAISTQLAGSDLKPSPGRLQANNTALFVCDVQERFRPIISGFAGVVDTAQRLVKGANALEIPIIVTEQYPKALGNTVEEVKQHLPNNSLIQDKLDFTMFVDPVRQHMKQLKDRSKVLLLGIETHVCVFQTALDLIEAGYEVHLVVDGVSSKRPTDRAVAIQRIAQMGGLLVSSEMALFQLCGHSKHPAFKAISALAKESRPEFLQTTSNL